MWFALNFFVVILPCRASVYATRVRIHFGQEHLDYTQSLAFPSGVKLGFSSLTGAPTDPPEKMIIFVTDEEAPTDLLVKIAFFVTDWEPQ